jgi:hypothetical protein
MTELFVSEAKAQLIETLSVGASGARHDKLSFYRSGPPAGEMVLEELERCALDRFTVLHAISLARVRKSLSDDAHTQKIMDERVPL